MEERPISLACPQGCVLKAIAVMVNVIVRYAHSGRDQNRLQTRSGSLSRRSCCSIFELPTSNPSTLVRMAKKKAANAITSKAEKKQKAAQKTERKEKATKSRDGVDGDQDLEAILEKVRGCKYCYRTYRPMPNLQ